MNCNNYVDVNFARYILVSEFVQVVYYPVLADIPVAIDVCIDNIALFKNEIEYTLPQPELIPNPCYPQDPSKSIEITEVTLNAVQIAGDIGYYVGVDVLDDHTNVILTPPISKLNFVSAPGTADIPLSDLVYLDDPTEPIPPVQVTVMDLLVREHMFNEEGEQVYLVTGTFRIEPSVV